MSGVERPLPLLPAASVAEEGTPLLRAPLEGQHIVADYGSIGLSLRRHPLALLRERLGSAASCRRSICGTSRGRMVSHGGPGDHAPAARQRLGRHLRHP